MTVNIYIHTSLHFFFSHLPQLLLFTLSFSFFLFLFTFFFVNVFIVAMSNEALNNLKSQLKLYQQMFEQMEAGQNSEAPPPSLVPNNIVKPKVRYIKMEEILKIFNITKVEYNNILVRINFISYI